MFERVKYQNHLGQVFDFGVDGIFLNYNDLRDYEWEPQIQGNRITKFKRGITQKTLPIVIIKNTEDEAIAAMNRLFEVAEQDVIALKVGKIIIGDYYFTGYIHKKQNAEWLRAPEFFKTTLTLTSEFPFWVSERKFELRKLPNPDSFDNLEYPYDYPYDYYGGSGSQMIVNNYFAPVDFRMIIYGAVVNPSVNIGGHSYKVNTTVQAGEYLTIDSTTKTIVLTKNNGEKFNKYDNRDRTSYIFEQIPSGASNVSWIGDFAVDITTLEARSEPKWT